MGNPAFLATAALVALTGCATSNPYETAKQTTDFKRVPVPLAPGTRFVVSQGAFGKATHDEEGNQYSWDLDVPYGTPVLSIDAGKVLSIWAPDEPGGCDPWFANYAHNVKVEHSDGSVAQYVHMTSKVKVGEKVSRGQVIGVTSRSGYICQPQLHFSVYASKDELYDSPKRRTLPLYFLNVPGGILREGQDYEVAR